MRTVSKFKPGNKLWQQRKPDFNKRKRFTTPQQLWAACVEYFEWVEANPLTENKVFQYQGELVHGSVEKMRAMTIQGLAVHIGIDRRTWQNYRTDDTLAEAVELVEEIIYEQKFTGAAAELLNATIISRSLGLREGIEHTGADGGPITHGVLAVPAGIEDWDSIAQTQQAELKSDTGAA